MGLKRVHPAVLVRSMQRRGWTTVVAASVIALPVAVLPVVPAPPAAAEPGRVSYPAVATGDWPGLVVGLGDSVPAGSACGCVSFVSLVGQALAGGDARVARVRNLSWGGATTSGVATQVRNPGVRRTIAGASVVLVDVGANDLSQAPLRDPACRPQVALPCYRTALASQAARLERLLRQVVALARAGGGIVLVTGYWNVFLDGAAGRAKGTDYVTGSDALTRAFDVNVKTVAQRTGAVYADTYTPFKGQGRLDCTSLLAADGDHPNAKGHQVIAAAMLAALRSVGRTSDPDRTGPAGGPPGVKPAGRSWSRL